MKSEKVPPLISALLPLQTATRFIKPLPLTVSLPLVTSMEYHTSVLGCESLLPLSSSVTLPVTAIVSVISSVISLYSVTVAVPISLALSKAS